MTVIRNFDTGQYSYWDTKATKLKAQEYARVLRKSGKKVRVTRVSGGQDIWDIWVKD